MNTAQDTHRHHTQPHRSQEDGSAAPWGDSPAPSRPPSRRPKLELGSLLRQFAAKVFPQLKLGSTQKNVLGLLMACRTSEMGGHLDKCDVCGEQRPSYDSCRDRHCPKCQGSAGAKWVEQRMKTVLPTHYFHLVFTVPSEIRGIFLGNRKLMFDLLFRSVAETLKELSNDPEWLGAQPGFSLILHTWSKDMSFHPHLHVVITGGGLSQDKKMWKSVKGKYLFPVRVMSALFRGKLLDGLRTLYEGGKLTFSGKQEHLGRADLFNDLVQGLYAKDWVVYAKKPFAGPEAVYKYLSLYTHRVAMSNRRLLKLDGDRVSLRTRGKKEVVLKVGELIRRFAQHILPAGYVRIRHYGLVASANVNTKLKAAREVLGSVGGAMGVEDGGSAKSRDSDRQGEEEADRDPRCPRCGAPMCRLRSLERSPSWAIWKRVMQPGRRTVEAKHATMASRGAMD